MKLNPNVNVPSFLKAVLACSGEVYFITPEGDRINLKSTLSQYMFAAAISERLQYRDAGIFLQKPEDAVLLQDFCSPDE